MATTTKAPKATAKARVKPAITENTPNTPAPASSETAAAVLETAPVSAGATSSTAPAVEGETTKSDDKANSPIEGELVMTHGIKAVESRGICRAGVRWHQEETFTNRADWTDEQWEAITNERLLIVREL